jgi:hypothetical protein
MKQIDAELRRLINTCKSSLDGIRPGSLDTSPAPGKWSGKEIIGHLVDSAQTNIRRMVVAQYEEQPLIVYNQDKWVKAAGYANRDIKELVGLWYLLNIQMAAVLENMSDQDGERLCRTPVPETLRWLAEDYIKHLRHHMHQVLAWEPVPYP